MALLTPMTLEAARHIGRAYGLDVVSVEALRVGSVNSNFRFRTGSGASFFARVYEEQGPAGAAAELHMLSELQRLGVPTAAPSRLVAGGGHAASHQGKPVGVVPWIDGEILCLGRITESVARRLGRALAGVHAASASLGVIPEGRFGVEGLRARLDAIERATERFQADVAFIRERLERYAAVPSETLPRGLIHGDLFRDNVLWRRGEASSEELELVALIDFESASRGVFVYDLMVTIHAWCYGSKFDLRLVRALIDGYCGVRALGRGEYQALRSQGALAALRFATTRITDFSMRTSPGEAPARDYQRFLARLEAIEQGALDPIIERGTA